MRKLENRGNITIRTVVLVLAMIGVPGRPAVAGGNGGTITGKVEATPAKYLADTIVYLKQAPGTCKAKTTTMDQKGMKFIPHILTICVGDSVKFLNHDGVDHNVFSPDLGGYNLGMFKGGETRSYTFTKEGVYTQLCSVHPEMLAFVFVGQNPYAAVVDATGSFTIKNVPPGSYEVAVWNPKLKADVKSVTVTAGKPAEVSFALKR
jgi:plastocyanin